MLSTGVVSLLDVESCSSGASAGSKAARVSGTARASGARRSGARTVHMVGMSQWRFKQRGCGMRMHPWNAQLVPGGRYGESVGQTITRENTDGTGSI